MATLLDVAAIPRPVHDVARFFQQIGGVGEKTALRYALSFATNQALAVDLGEALLALALNVKVCPRCHAISDDTGCSFCARNVFRVCVIHRYQDLLAIEKAITNKSLRYFVLNRLLSPLDGVHSEDLPMDALRAQVESAEEVILALPPSTDGEATALFLAKELATSTRTVTRLARGLAHGSAIEFADPVTMAGAFDSRTPLT